MTRPFIHSVDNLRLGEFDLGGVLYHANYYHLYEHAREALLAQGGLPYHQLVADGSHLAIAEAGQKFLAPVRYGDPLKIELAFREPTHVTVTAEYRISIERGNAISCVHEGWTRLVFVKIQDGRFKASRFPEKLVEIFEKYRS